MPSETVVVEADLSLADQAGHVAELINEYACDAMGQGQQLSEDVRAHLIPGLRDHPAGFHFLAYQNCQPVGLAVCFLGFSTFAARPLINIHGLMGRQAFRRQGSARELIEHVARKARELECCKLTLEVREDNEPAKATYRLEGFRPAVPPQEFWSKPL